MDTSLAEEVQHTATTLQSDSFFFMSPYRSFTTSGCFARFSEPAVGGDDPAGPFQQKLAQAFRNAKNSGIAHPVMVGAIPFDTRHRCLFHNAGKPSPARRVSSPHVMPPARRR